MASASVSLHVGSAPEMSFGPTLKTTSIGVLLVHHQPCSGSDRLAPWQTFNVKFRFDDSGLEVVLGKEEEETENAFVGGKNRWEFDSFTNWEFWWPSFPVLVYFKVRSGAQFLF